MKQGLYVAGCGKLLWKQVLLVTLSFASMFQQAKASRDRAGGAVRRCRCAGFAGIAASHTAACCNPHK